MKLESQVCSLELAKKLKELGVKQESYVSWVKTSSGQELWDTNGMRQAPRVTTYSNDVFSAFTVAELGEMLPEYHATYKVAGAKTNWMGQDILGDDQFTIEDGFTIQEATEADARAKMLVYLIENKLVAQEE